MRLRGGSHVNLKESSMKHVLQNERGMALAIAIVALVIVGALIAGAFFSGTQEQRVAENVRRVQASFGVAEEGVYDIIRTWDSIGVGGVQNKVKYAALYPYPAFPAAKDTSKYGWETAKSRTGSYSGSVMKLNDELYLIDMSARDTMSLAGRIRGGGAGQRLGLLARIRPMNLNTQAALAQSANINVPAQNFSTSIAPVTIGTACDLSVPTDWGSPSTPAVPCSSYFPIIHITGDGAVINGQEGQGVLLVDGSLSVQGGFQFFGVVIVKGSLKTSGGGSTPAHFWGTVMVQDTAQFTDTTNNLSGSANLLYSKCAIIRALNKTGVAGMMRSRGWVQLY